MESKKEKAFRLFDQGFSPISPEVKALGLKNHSRGTYYWEWRTKYGGSSPTKSSGGESLGSIDESKQPKTEAKPAAVEANEEEPDDGVEANEEEVVATEDEEEAKTEKAQESVEAVGTVSEAVAPKGKEGKPAGPEKKIATTIADDGIKCTVFLSLQTLALFKIAAATQQAMSNNGAGQLSLGDFLDTCAEDYFSGRGKKLGLIVTGGK